MFPAAEWKQEEVLQLNAMKQCITN